VQIITISIASVAQRQGWKNLGFQKKFFLGFLDYLGFKF